MLDFKDDILSEEVLIEKGNSKTLYWWYEHSFKNTWTFKYNKDNVLERERIVYKKGGVTFELDSYYKPRKSYVVAIEGEKEEVDKVYKELIRKSVLINE